MVYSMVYMIYTDEQLQLNRGCYLAMHAMLPDGFLFSQFNLTYNSLCFMPVLRQKCRSVLHHCVVIFFWFSGIKDCMLITFEFRLCARERQWYDIFHYH